MAHVLSALALPLTFVLAGPAEDVEVQRPGQAAETGDTPATEPETEPEPTPSDGTEPAPAEDEPEAEPEPAPTGGIVPLGAAEEPAPEPETAPEPEGGAITSWRDAAPAPADYDRPGQQDDIYRPPVYRGTGLFITGGLAFGTIVLKQGLSPIFCNGDGNLNCDSVGWVDRSFAAATIGLIGGGGWMRGKWAATEGGKDFSDDAVRKRKIAGWTLAGVGFAGAAVDFGFALACWSGAGVGPYAYTEDTSPFVVKCRSTASGLAMDASTILAASGMGLGLWANAYKDTRSGDQARITNITPMLGRGHWGVGVGGTF